MKNCILISGRFFDKTVTCHGMAQPVTARFPATSVLLTPSKLPGFYYWCNKFASTNFKLFLELILPVCILCTKSSFKSEDTGRFLLLQENIPNLYPEQEI